MVRGFLTFEGGWMLMGLCLSAPMLTADAACTAAGTQGQDGRRCFLGWAPSFLQNEMLPGGERRTSAVTTFVVSHLVAVVPVEGCATA